MVLRCGRQLGGHAHADWDTAFWGASVFQTHSTSENSFSCRPRRAQCLLQQAGLHWMGLVVSCLSCYTLAYRATNGKVARLSLKLPGAIWGYQARTGHLAPQALRLSFLLLKIARTRRSSLPSSGTVLVGRFEAHRRRHCFGNIDSRVQDLVW